MGRIIASVTISNLKDKAEKIRIDALVDTGASHIILPAAWKERLGELGEYEPLLGYIPLEQSQAAVDMLGHRLVHVKRLDLKSIANKGTHPSPRKWG